MDVQAFIAQLPEEPPTRLLSWAKEELRDEIGGAYTVFHCERRQRPPELHELMDGGIAPGKKEWVTVCTCTECREEWVTQKGPSAGSFYVNIGEDGGTYVSDVTDPDDWDNAYEVRITEDDGLTCPICWAETRAIQQKNIRGGRTKRLQVAQLRNIGNITTIIYWLVGRDIYEYGDTLGAVPRYAYALDEKGRIKAFAHKEGGGGYGREKQTYWHKLANNDDRWYAQYQD